MTDPPKFLDAESFQGGKEQEMNFRSIALRHYERCITLGSVGFQAGFYQSLQTSPGVFSRIYVPGTYQAYIDAVDTLENALYAHFDDDHREASASFRVREQELRLVCQVMARRLKKPGRWPELYQKNVMDISKEKFRWLSMFLYKKGYLEGGVLSEEAA